MNWDMLGAVGEIVGAAAVVLTLGYLALQVRESARQDRRQQSAALQQHLVGILNVLVTDDRMPLIFLKGLRDFSALDDEERLRFGAWMLSLLRAHEATFHFGRERGIVTYHEETLARTLQELMASPGGQAWWQSRRAWFSVQFQAEIDGWATREVRPFVERYAPDPA